MTQISLDADHPALPGHFPGYPVMPAAVVLEHIVDAARRHWPGIPVTGVRKAKFLRQAVPGQTLSVEWGQPGGDALKFICRHDTAIVVQERLSLGEGSEP
jgi:3-hydroxymyristoyl/3-hydroxydecanoyl-(acyl carrier protein) dehydratase